MSRGSLSLPAERWVTKIARKFEPLEQNLIPILQFVQNEEGYLSPEAMQAAARHLRVPEAKVYGVASFYSLFHFEPRGRHTITVCRGTACHVRGSGALLQELEKRLGVVAGGTTPDLQFTLETVACFGSCALAPVVVADARVRGRQTKLSVKAMVDEIEAADGKAGAGVEKKKSGRSKGRRTKTAGARARA